jgi:ABC-2 type transport system permease protein
VILHTLRYELLALGRNKRARLFTLAFPLLLLVVLSGVSGNSPQTTFDGHAVSLQRFFLPGILAMSIVTSCFAALVQVVVTRRHVGIYRRRRATPVPAHVLIAAQMLATTILGAAAATILVVVGKAAFGVGIAAGPLVAVGVTFVLGALCCCAVGFLVASVVPSPDTAQPVVQFVMFPVLFISGIWFTRDDMPQWLRAVGDVLPVAHLSDALHQAVQASSFSAAFAPGDLAVLAAWGAGAAWLASRRFSWLPSTEAAAA